MIGGLLWVVAIHAETAIRSVDERGHVTYSDKPVPDAVKSETVPLAPAPDPQAVEAARQEAERAGELADELRRERRERQAERRAAEAAETPPPPPPAAEESGGQPVWVERPLLRPRPPVSKPRPPGAGKPDHPAFRPPAGRPRPPATIQPVPR